MRYEVFLSHSSADREHVARVKQQAAALGVDLYTAEHDIQAGRQLDEKVLTAVARSDAVVVLLSTDGYNSAYVQQEIGAARMAEKLVIPLVSRDIQKASLGMLEGKDYIEFDAAHPENATNKLMQYLGRLAQEKETRELRRQQELVLILSLVVLLLLLALASPPS